MKKKPSEKIQKQLQTLLTKVASKAKKEKGVTYVEIAEKMNVSKQWVGMTVKNNDKYNATIESLINCLSAYGVQVDFSISEID